MRRVGTIAHVVMMALFMSGAAAQTASVPEARLKAIYAMTPQQMAETGQWTKQAYDRMLGYINNIQDKDIRELVLDMVLRPESKVFKAKATQSFLASPARRMIRRKATSIRSASQPALPPRWAIPDWREAVWRSLQTGRFTWRPSEMTPYQS